MGLGGRVGEAMENMVQNETKCLSQRTLYPDPIRVYSSKP